MPRKGRKRPDSFTVIVVPHSEKPSFTVRIPFWTIYVAIGLCLVGLASMTFLILDYQDASAQLAELRRGEQRAIIQRNELSGMIAAGQRRENSLQAMIADQAARSAEQINDWADQAALFNEEVARLYAQIAELEQFKTDIRRIVGLDKVTPTPSAGESKTQAKPTVTTAIGPLEPLTGDRVALSLSNRGAERSVSAQDAIQATADLLENAIPQQKAELEALKQEVSQRVAKIDGKWQSPEQLSRELSVYDASPRAWPVYGPITARFGYDARRLELGAQPYHKGIDIGGSIGTAVRAPQDGLVVNAGWNGTYGLTIQIQHSMGWATYYAHLSSVPVKIGETVKKGQVIGYIGMTGLTTGAHLHYEVYLNGLPIDPLKYLGR